MSASRVRFEALLDRAERRRSAKLSFAELREIGALYQLHASLLARLRDDGDDPAELRHVNALCVRGHALLYAASGPTEAPLSASELLARTWRVQVVAWWLLLLGGLLGSALVLRDPGTLPALVPASLGYEAGFLEELWESPEARSRFLEGHDVPFSQNVLFGSSLFANNTRVGILAFAVGMLGGVPTALLQLYNGLTLGALSTVFFRDPWPLAYLAWILPHGVPELYALCLCAAAGLSLGAAVAAPGRRGRRAALADALRPVVFLLGLAAPLFVAAALIESFVRESSLGLAPRFLVVAAWLGLGAAFLFYVRRAARARGEARHWLDDVRLPRNEARGTG